jgi:hypothetical protein
MGLIVQNLGREVLASLEPRDNKIKSLLAKRNSKQTPQIEGLSYRKMWDSESDSMGRKLSSEYAGTMKVFHKKLDDTQNDGRCDRFGNLIISGSKEHRIWFRDEVGEGHVEIVKEVESYKVYYKDKSFISWSWIIM